MATVVAPDEIERALREALPPELRAQAPALARQIIAATDEAAGEAPPPAAPALAPALRALAGQELRAGQAVVSFGPGAQTGDVTISDVAGGDLVKVTLVITPERRGLGLTRARLVAALALVALVTAALAVAYLRLPATMAGLGTFAIAVADVAGPDGRRDPQAGELGALVYRSLLQQQEQYLAVDSGDVIAVWHDSMGPLAKRATVGVVAGPTPEARESAARAALERLGADLLVYGQRDAQGRVTLRFYARPPAGGGAATLAGDYQLGDPIDPRGTRLTTRAGALFWLIKALQDDYEGDQEQMRAVLARAEQALPGWRAAGEGKELLWLFQGQAALWLAQRAPAQPAFDELMDEADAALRRAREARPGFLHAAIVEVSAALVRAQCALGAAGLPCEPLPADGPARLARLDEARRLVDGVFATYPQALAAADPSADRLWADGVGPTTLGFAHFLRGELAYLERDDAVAEAAYAEAQATIGAGLPVLAAGGNPRLLATYHMLIGKAADRRAELAADEAGRAARREEARAAYAACVAQGEGGDDQILRDEVAGLCARYLRELETP